MARTKKTPLQACRAEARRRREVRPLSRAARQRLIHQAEGARIVTGWLGRILFPRRQSVTITHIILAIRHLQRAEKRFNDSTKP